MITVNNVQYLNFICEHKKQQFNQAEINKIMKEAYHV